MSERTNHASIPSYITVELVMNSVISKMETTVYGRK